MTKLIQDWSRQRKPPPNKNQTPGFPRRSLGPTPSSQFVDQHYCQYAQQKIHIYCPGICFGLFNGVTIITSTFAHINETVRTKKNFGWTWQPYSGDYCVTQTRQNHKISPSVLIYRPASPLSLDTQLCPTNLTYNKDAPIPSLLCLNISCKLRCMKTLHQGEAKGENIMGLLANICHAGSLIVKQAKLSDEIQSVAAQLEKNILKMNLMADAPSWSASFWRLMYLAYPPMLNDVIIKCSLPSNTTRYCLCWHLTWETTSSSKTLFRISYTGLSISLLIACFKFVPKFCRGEIVV